MHAWHIIPKSGKKAIACIYFLRPATCLSAACLCVPTTAGPPSGRPLYRNSLRLRSGAFCAVQTLSMTKPARAGIGAFGRFPIAYPRPAAASISTSSVRRSAVIRMTQQTRDSLGIVSRNPFDVVRGPTGRAQSRVARPFTKHLVKRSH